MQFLWQFKQHPKSQATGFVNVDDAVASELLDKGYAQRPDVGALHLKEIEPGEAAPVKKPAKGQK